MSNKIELPIENGQINWKAYVASFLKVVQSLEDPNEVQHIFDDNATNLQALKDHNLDLYLEITTLCFDKIYGRFPVSKLANQEQTVDEKHNITGRNIPPSWKEWEGAVDEITRRLRNSKLEHTLERRKLVQSAAAELGVDFDKLVGYDDLVEEWGLNEQLSEGSLKDESFFYDVATDEWMPCNGKTHMQYAKEKWNEDLEKCVMSGHVRVGFHNGELYIDAKNSKEALAALRAANKNIDINDFDEVGIETMDPHAYLTLDVHDALYMAQTGRVSRSKMHEAFGRRREDEKKKKEEQDCFNCDGNGYINQYSKDVPCPSCHGRGKIVEDVVDFGKAKEQRSKLSLVKDNGATVTNINSIELSLTARAKKAASLIKRFIDTEGKDGIRVVHNFIDHVKAKMNVDQDAVDDAFSDMYGYGSVRMYILDKETHKESVTEGISSHTASKCRNDIIKFVRNLTDSSNIVPLSNFESYEKKSNVSLKLSVYGQTGDSLKSISKELANKLVADEFVNVGKDAYKKNGILVKVWPVNKVFRTGAYKNRETPHLGIEVYGPKKLTERK